MLHRRPAEQGDGVAALVEKASKAAKAAEKK
jgi:hypothetical protein